jgi:hypothetical protein
MLIPVARTGLPFSPEWQHDALNMWGYLVRVYPLTALALAFDD